MMELLTAWINVLPYPGSLNMRGARFQIPTRMALTMKKINARRQQVLPGTRAVLCPIQTKMALTMKKINVLQKLDLQTTRVVPLKIPMVTALLTNRINVPRWPVPGKMMDVPRFRNLMPKMFSLFLERQPYQNLLLPS